MIYVPVLKYKQGEKDALYTLDDKIKDNVLPLIEVTPDTISKFNGVAEFWDDRDYILDVSPEYYHELTTEEYKRILKYCKKEHVIPCVNLLDNEHRISYLSENINGIAVRIFLNEILDDEFDVNFSNLIKLISCENTDLIIDLQYIDPRKLNEVIFLTRSVINMLSNLNQFRRIILASNSFPKTLDVDKDKLTLLPRIESKIYNKVKLQLVKKDINLIYSDYAVNHWSYFEFIPGMQPSFNIRYTFDDKYVIYKGDTIKRGGLDFDKVKRGCDLLVTSSYYLGDSYSWGDHEIYEKHVKNTNKPGSLTTWRAIGTSHHICHVVKSLSNQS